MLRQFCVIMFFMLACMCIRIQAAATAYPIPAEWQSKIDRHQAVFAPSDDGMIDPQTDWPVTTNGPLFMPLMGNGYVSHAHGVRGNKYYISGVFNNMTTSPAHRAILPATMAVQVDDSVTTGTLLDLEVRTSSKF